MFTYFEINISTLRRSKKKKKSTVLASIPRVAHCAGRAHLCEPLRQQEIDLEQDLIALRCSPRCLHEKCPRDPVPQLRLGTIVKRWK